MISERLNLDSSQSLTCTQHLELIWRSKMPIAMIKGWRPSIRSSSERDSSLLGLLAKLSNLL
jgi:hypothetical protein